jgi:hypothetical protein
MRRYLGTMIKIILAVFDLTIILIASLFVAVHVSPKPFAWYVRTQFDTGVGEETALHALTIPTRHDRLRGSPTEPQVARGSPGGRAVRDQL